MTSELQAAVETLKHLVIDSGLYGVEKLTPIPEIETILTPPTTLPPEK